MCGRPITDLGTRRYLSALRASMFFVSRHPRPNGRGYYISALRASHPSKIKHNLFLQTILTWCEGVQGHEEVRKLTAVAQLVLDEQQTLECDLPGEPEIEAKVMRANVHARVGS